MSPTPAEVWGYFCSGYLADFATRLAAAWRFRWAAAILALPSALMIRLTLTGLAVVPLGRPGPRLRGVPGVPTPAMSFLAAMSCASSVSIASMIAVFMLVLMQVITGTALTGMLCACQLITISSSVRTIR